VVLLVFFAVAIHAALKSVRNYLNPVSQKQAVAVSENEIASVTSIFPQETHGSEKAKFAYRVLEEYTKAQNATDKNRAMDHYLEAGVLLEEFNFRFPD
jgi:glutamate-1-semialdehyde aminotransferase